MTTTSETTATTLDEMIRTGYWRNWDSRDSLPLDYLRLQGLTVTAKAEGVLNLAPSSRIKPELRDHAKRHKAAILASLQAESARLAAEPFCITCHRWRCTCRST